ncbi:hypothetical protein [Streptomyces albus]|uniref:hypothetical protein n=1 Tax=Streptomyces albus TaxID=1888 RepID=UPI0004CBD8B0|nr:hypothetical protein [Streptomyces albus]
MSIRHTAKARRRAAAVALAAGFVLAVAGCGEGGGEKSGKESSSGEIPDGNSDGGGKGEEENSSPPSEPSKTIAELKGEKGLVLAVHEVKRDSGGFLTLNGTVRNEGDKPYFDTTKWQGNEKEIVNNGYSLGGAALVDQKGKKRYYTLRDTEGRCLCTTGITKVEPGKEIPVFVQFPAPPEGTTEVEFSLPTFDSATVEITE